MRIFNIFLLSCLFVLSCNAIINNQPVIGVVTVPSDYPELRDANEWAYIQLNTVQFLETAGARVVPIPYNLPKDNLTSVFNQINGLLFPGGSTNLFIKIDNNDNHNMMTEYVYQTRFLIELAVEANNRGDYFPIWGTCQGLELILMVFSDNADIFDFYYQDNVMANISVLPEARNGPLFGGMEDRLIHALEHENASWLSHDWGLSPHMYEQTPGIRDNFDMLALANDSNNKEFVSALQAKKYPIYLTQFHPERNGFEWFDSETIPHTPEAVEIGTYMANFLVDEARKNNHRFDSAGALDSRVIDNEPITVVPVNPVPVYFFKTSSN